METQISFEGNLTVNVITGCKRPFQSQMLARILDQQWSSDMCTFMLQLKINSDSFC